jgi:hypothetical protein
MQSKYDSWKVPNSYMFRHQGAIVRESSRTQEYKPSKWIWIRGVTCWACVHLLFKKPPWRWQTDVETCGGSILPMNCVWLGAFVGWFIEHNLLRSSSPYVIAVGCFWLWNYTRPNYFLTNCLRDKEFGFWRVLGKGHEDQSSTDATSSYCACQ